MLFDVISAYNLRPTCSFISLQTLCISSIIAFECSTMGLNVRNGFLVIKKAMTVISEFACFICQLSLASASSVRSNPLLWYSYLPDVKKYKVFSRSKE